jgi:hypothetical protein
VTIHVPTRQLQTGQLQTQTRPGPATDEVDSLPLASFASVRLAVVLWGGLVLVDLGRLAHAPSYLDLALVALLVAAASIRMRAGTAVAAALVGWLLVDGFVEHRYGSLGYDGLPDTARLALLVAVAVVATRVHR